MPRGKRKSNSSEKRTKGNSKNQKQLLLSLFDLKRKKKKKNRRRGFFFSKFIFQSCSFSDHSFDPHFEIRFIKQASSSPRATRGVAARAAAVPKTSKTANSSCSLTTSTSMTTSSPPLNNDSAFGRAAFAALAAAIFVLGSPVGPAMAVSGGGGTNE